MKINVAAVILIIIFASLSYWANETLNQVPGLKPIVKVLIVAISIILLLQAIGLIGYIGTITI